MLTAIPTIILQRLRRLQILMRVIGLRSIFGILLCALITGCQTPAPTPTPKPPTSVPTAVPTPIPTAPRQINSQPADLATSGTVRFILAVPDQPPVDVYIEGTLITADALGYGKFTTPFSIAPDKYTIHIVSAGQPIRATGDLLDQPLTTTGQKSTIYVIGGATGKLTLTPIVEALDPMSLGQARVTIISTTTDSNPINVAIDAQQAGALQTTVDTVPAQVINAGKHLLRFTTNGQTVMSQTVTLLERQAYTIFLLGARSLSPQLVVVDSQTPQQAQLRVINASPLSGAVDVYIGQTHLAANLAYRKFTDWQTVPPFNNYEVHVMKAGAAITDTPLYTNSISLLPDAQADLVLFDRSLTQQDDTGRAVSQSVSQAQLFTETLTATASGQARLAVLNLAPNAAAIQTMISGQAVSALPPINYGTLSPDLAIPPGNLALSFDQASSNVLGHVELIAPLSITAGTDYLYIVTGIKDRATTPLLLTTAVGTAANAAATISADSIMQIRAVNALGDVSNVDGYQGAQKIFSGLNQGQSTPILDVDRSLGDIRFTVSGSDQTLTTVQLPKQPTATMSLVALGTAKSARVILSVDKASVSGSATVRVIQAASGTAITVGAANASASTKIPEISIARRLEFPAISVPTPVRPGTYTLTVYKAADVTRLAQLGSIRLDANTFYDVLILPGANGNVNVSLITTPLSTPN